MMEILNQLGGYGKIIKDALYIIVGGMLLIYCLQRLTKRFIFPHLKRKRLVHIVFGALYTLVFVISVLLALDGLGLDIRDSGELAIFIVLIGGVMIFFLSPYLPSLPFRTGHLVEVGGVFGKVESIAAYHTTIKKFNGTIAYIPNTGVIGSTIINYSVKPSLRIELTVSVESTCDLEKALSSLILIMKEDSRVLDTPAVPFVEVLNVQASGIDVMAACWVNNEDYIATRSDLWRRIVQEFRADRDLALSLPQQEILLTHMKGEVPT